MLLSYVLAILYFLFFTYLIYHLNFFKNLNIPFIILITIFIIKIFAGFVYAKFYLQPEYAVLADTWRYYALSVDEMYKILKNPSLFFSEILNPSLVSTIVLMRFLDSAESLSPVIKIQ